MLKDRTIGVRVTWETWSLLEQIRAQRETEQKRRVKLSEIVREVLENHVGKTWQKNQ